MEKKKINLSFLSLFLLGGIFTFFMNSCSDSCKDVVCGIREQCLNGHCACLSGYEGDNCEVFSYEKFVGSYQVQQFCAQGQAPPPYPVTITYQGGRIDRVLIGNMFNMGITVEAYVSERLMQIPQQQIGSLSISGNGTYQTANGRINASVEYVFAGQYHSCNLTFIP